MGHIQSQPTTPNSHDLDFCLSQSRLLEQRVIDWVAYKQ